MGLCTLPGAGGQEEEAAGSVVALRSTCAWSQLPGQSQRLSARLPVCGRGGLPIPASASLLETGAAAGGKGEQMEGLEELWVAAVSRGHGDPSRWEEEQGLAGRLAAAGVGARPSIPYRAQRVQSLQPALAGSYFCTLLYTQWLGSFKRQARKSNHNVKPADAGDSSVPR